MGARKNVSIEEFACGIIDFFKTHPQGTVLFFNAEDEVGKLIVEDGEIVALQYKGEENEAALISLGCLTTVRYRCHPYRLSPKKRIHLSFEDFFRQIGSLEISTLYDLAKPVNQPCLSEINPEVKLDVKLDFSSTLLAVKALFQDAVGPISGFIYDDLICELGIPGSAAQLKALLDRLAQEIENSEHQQQFKYAAMNLISS